MVITARQCVEGAVIPRGWAVAWHNFNLDSAVILPIPLHWMAAKFRHLWLRLRRAGLRGFGFDPE